MMTVREARNRCNIHGFVLQGPRDGEFRLADMHLPRAEQEASAYYTDDAEDAALTAGMMRNRTKAKQAA